MKNLNNNMESFSCFYSTLKDNNLIKSKATACWGGIKVYDPLTQKYSKVNVKEIYIENFERISTSKYIKLLVKTINKITPCEVVTIENKKYIKCKLLRTYDQSLILLNFIRNLWYSPTIYNYFEKVMPPKGFYSITFFKELKKSRFKDPLKRLTKANLIACTKINSKAYAGHSNCNNYNLLKIKSTEELLKYEGTSTSQFLTT